MRMGVLVGCVAIVLSIPGQTAPEFKKPTPKVIKSSSTAPVTKAEAKKVLDRAWKALSKGLRLPEKSPVSLIGSADVITKNEILAQFDSIVASATPGFKRSPRAAKYWPERFRKDADQKSLNLLAAKGLIMPLGPLATGKDGPVSTQEFGDALGVLIFRIADLCHLPNSNFSPSLKGG